MLAQFKKTGIDKMAVSVNDIKKAANNYDLCDLVNRAAYEAECNLCSEGSFKDAANFYRSEVDKVDDKNGKSKMNGLIKILDTASTRKKKLDK